MKKDQALSVAARCCSNSLGRNDSGYEVDASSPKSNSCLGPTREASIREFERTFTIVTAREGGVGLGVSAARPYLSPTATIMLVVQPNTTSSTLLEIAPPPGAASSALPAPVADLSREPPRKYHLVAFTF